MSKRLLDAETRYPELDKLAQAPHGRIQKTEVILSCTPDLGLNQLPTALSTTKVGSLR